jgi:RNA polymerase sigma factor (sigma-70 family)
MLSETTSISEQKLIEQAHQRVPYAYARLAERIRGKVHSFVHQFIKNRQDAEEIVQDVLLKMDGIITQPSFRCETFFGLLKRMSYHMCIDALRKKRLMFNTDAGLDNIADDGTAEAVNDQALYDKMYDLIDKLPPVRKEIVQMALRSMTFRQIGLARGGKSAKDMSSQHSKAVQFMQKCAGGAAGRRKKICRHEDVNRCEAPYSL